MAWNQRDSGEEIKYLNKRIELILKSREKIWDKLVETQAKNKSLRSDVKLWQRRTDEAAKVVETFEEIQAENEKLKTAYDIMSTSNAQKAEAADWFETENKELKRKAKIIKIGNLMPPDFNPKPTEFFGDLHLDKPENAYYYGWQSAILECGEILSK